MAASVALIGVLIFLLFGTTEMSCNHSTVASGGNGAAEGQGNKRDSQDGQATDGLFVYCAAGMRYPMEKIKADYEQEFGSRGVKIQLQYNGSNTLLSQLEVSKTGDLYLAADDSYIHMAREKGLVVESIPIAKMRPVIAVQRNNEKKISSVDDLLHAEVRVALADPGAAAVGKKTKRLLSASGQWGNLEKHATSNGVFKPTVNDVANAVKLGSVDAGIIWDSTAAQYPELKAIQVPELDAGTATVEIGVVSTCKSPTAALHFARYVTARDRGQESFGEMGWELVDGDLWADHPELNFFVGAVNRRALEPILQRFEQREGVTLNTVYDGCGILTARMRSITETQSGGFPDTYMACDVYYLNTVREMFQDAVNVSDTDIVIAVAKGNPKGIRSPEDLLRPDVRVVLGNPKQCTIGVLSRRLLEDKGIYGRLMSEKDIPAKPTSALLLPDITIGASDATLAYLTDTKALADKVDTIPIDSQLSKAIQPYAVARSSDHKQLSRRLYAAIAHSRDSFEAAGFNWRLDEVHGGP
jgi:molybdenum ABC transporter molybdate-binding protein